MLLEVGVAIGVRGGAPNHQIALILKQPLNPILTTPTTHIRRPQTHHNKHLFINHFDSCGRVNRLNLCLHDTSL